MAALLQVIFVLGYLPASALAEEVSIADVLGQGYRLNSADLPELLSGSTLYGRYTDGRPDWAEQTAVTGQVYDITRHWLEVGVWGIHDDNVCYSYDVEMSGGYGGPFCYDVYEWKGQFYFFSVNSDNLVGYTYRVDRPSLM